VTAAEEPASAGTCACCGEPITAGEERAEILEQGSGVAPEMLLHAAPCRPRIETRRYLR
jgi:hypothetical protein